MDLIQQFEFNFDGAVFNSKRISRNERLCSLCDTKPIEDEMHFSFVCPRYAVPRKLLLDRVKSLICVREHISNIDALMFLLNNQCRIFAKYVKDCWNMRQHYLYNSTG